MPDYKGPDRRNDDGMDHLERDRLLTKIDANLTTHIQNFGTHAEEDKDHFERLYKTTNELRRFMYMAGGALVAFEMALKFFKKE